MAPDLEEPHERAPSTTPIPPLRDVLAAHGVHAVRATVQHSRTSIGRSQSSEEGPALKPVASTARIRSRRRHGSMVGTDRGARRCARPARRRRGRRRPHDQVRRHDPGGVRPPHRRARRGLRLRPVADVGPGAPRPRWRNLRGTDLQNASLRDADLSGADFTGACLAGADLRGAILTDARFTDADVRGAQVDADARETAIDWPQAGPVDSPCGPTDR